jgi:hypothetical protein
MRVYIAGRMSGMPEHNYPAFNAAEKLLTDKGYEAVNPVHHADGVGTEMPYDYYIRASIYDVLSVNAVAVLPYWYLSKGATLEVHIAYVLGLPVYNLDDLLMDRLEPLELSSFNVTYDEDEAMEAHVL